MYVGAFSLINAEVEPSLREFALGAASVADSIGIAVADGARTPFAKPTSYRCATMLHLCTSYPLTQATPSTQRV